MPGATIPTPSSTCARARGVTFSHCVPTILQMVLAAADRRGADLAGWLMTIGGSALTLALCREGRRRGMELVSGYGMSETAPLLTVSRPRREGGSDEVEALTMAGVPVPLVSVRVVSTRPCATCRRTASVAANWWYGAPWLTGCYVGDTRASDALWRGGWLHTQDVATLNREGYVQIRDRLKDVIKTGGEWLCSVTLEDMIADLPGIEQVAVIGVPHPHWG